MNNVILNTGLNIFELLSYFSCELVLIVGIILNVVLIPLIINNPKFKRISDLITCISFCLNSIILTFMVFQSEFFSIKEDLIVFNTSTLLLKLFINLFSLFFVIATYKFTRKTRHKVPLINSILILIVLLSGLLLTSDNFALVYILLEGIVVLIYKYASNMHPNKTNMYSPVFIAISFSATALFVTFYFMDFVVQDLLQKSIMQSCMSLALLLKIGLFPVYNYSIDKKCRNNIAYTILIFCFLPFVGAVAFNKIISLCMFNEVCQMCTAIFVIICALSATLYAYKIKNITGFLINVAQLYTCFYISNSIFTKDMNPKFMFAAITVLLILFAMLRLYKNNKKLTTIFSLILILNAFLIPLFGLDILYNIYTYDKTGFLAINAFIFCNMLVIIKTLLIAEGFYKTNNNS